MALDKMQGCVRWQSITPENGICRVLVPKFGADHTSWKNILGKKVLLVDTGEEEPPQMLPVKPAEPGASTGMLNENSILCGAVSLPVLGYTATGWDVVVPFPWVSECKMCPFLSWGGLVPLGYYFLVPKLEKSLQEESCWCLVLNI